MSNLNCSIENPQDVNVPNYKNFIRRSKISEDKENTKLIRKIADDEEHKVPATIDDPTILTEIKEDLIKHNILK